jgi:hypothetical protein
MKDWWWARRVSRRVSFWDRVDWRASNWDSRDCSFFFRWRLRVEGGVARGSDLASGVSFWEASSSASDSDFRFLIRLGAFWDSWAPKLSRSDRWFVVWSYNRFLFSYWFCATNECR